MPKEKLCSFTSALDQMSAGAVDPHAALSERVLACREARRLGCGLRELRDKMQRERRRLGKVREPLPSSVLPLLP